MNTRFLSSLLIAVLALTVVLDASAADRVKSNKSKPAVPTQRPCVARKSYRHFPHLTNGITCEANGPMLCGSSEDEEDATGDDTELDNAEAEPGEWTTKRSGAHEHRYQTRRISCR